jgi:Family of unknown function (DUF5985)
MMTYPGMEFVSGAIAMGHLTAAIFFARFWVRTRDLLFVAFAIAFSLLALNQVLSALAGVPREEQSWIYLIRLAAFALIAAAIAHKNVKR